MRVTLIHPSVGRKPGRPYVRSWQMEPLSIAWLAGLTPPDVELRFYDDRIEEVPFDEPTDLAAISVETFTALRAYRIARQFRARGVRVVLGGYHVTLIPEEAAREADAIVIGNAEPVWRQVLEDAQRGRLAARYDGTVSHSLAGLRPRRDVFQGKRYQRVALVESARGCCFGCEFCSITAFHGARQSRRPPREVAAEIEASGQRWFFIVDDNLSAHAQWALELCRELAPLGIRWVGQVDLRAARNDQLLQQMVASGCRGVLVGIESLDSRNLALMGKSWNLAEEDYSRSIRRLRQHGLAVYGTFLFGYDEDDADTIRRSISFAREEKLFLAAFNHLVPFPGTPLYRRLGREGRLLTEQWWLDPEGSVGKVVFRPQRVSPEELEQLCLEARREFYGWRSILGRLCDPALNASNPWSLATFLALNLGARRDIDLRHGLQLGAGPLVEKAQSMSRYRFELGAPGDDEELRAVLAATPMEGAIAVTFRREPSYFAASVVDGRFRQVLVARDEATGRIVAFGSRSVGRRYVNGRPAGIGYLSALRILPDHRRRSVLARGYALLRRLHEDGRTPLYLTTIAEDNRDALGALSGGRAGLPVYHDSGRYHTAAIRLAGARAKPGGSSGVEIREGRSADLPAVLSFLERAGPRRQFFPCYEPGDFGGDGGALRDLKPEDLCLAFREGDLVGTLGAWDQHAFRQTVIAGYGGAMRWLRPWYNAWAWLRALPRLPRPNEPLRYLTAALPLVADDDPEVFGRLLDALIRAEQRGPWEYLLVGMHESDPLLAALESRRAARYTTNLYLVCWEDGDSLRRSLDNRPIYLELGSL